jgi:carbamoyl-phosphate synthase small subunit
MNRRFFSRGRKSGDESPHSKTTPIRLIRSTRERAMSARLILEDGSTFAGTAFGWKGSVAGEVVFNTGMVGYPECLTDPSYSGQILTLTYPLVGNYGVPSGAPARFNPSFESERIHVSGLILAEGCAEASHWNSSSSLEGWLAAQKVPALVGVDTRALTQRLRAHGSMLGKLVHGEEEIDFRDPNSENLVARVSVQRPLHLGAPGKRRVVVVDCGCKNNIIRLLLRHGLAVTVVPWDWPLAQEECAGFVLSNGPGDPRACQETIEQVRLLLRRDVPVLGICLGNQILALAAGARTYKLKFGHRGQNQPCVLAGTRRCFITSQNHGYAVDERTLPPDWLPWFFNANDGTNEGIRHRSRPLLGVQFHPEAWPGPSDTEFVFDDFVQMCA